MEPDGPENLRPVFVTKNVLDNSMVKDRKKTAYTFCGEAGQYCIHRDWF